MQIARLGGPIV